MLLGGVLRPDGTPVSDLLSAPFLKDLHIKIAFVSCAGYTPEAGLTERDMREAQLKTGLLAAAQEVVALVDSSKFGKTSLAPFARAEQVAHLFTDSDVSPRRGSSQLQQICPMLTICAEDTASDFTPWLRKPSTTASASPTWARTCPFRSTSGAASSAPPRPRNIDLVVANNHLEPRGGAESGQRFVAQKLDLVIEYQIDEQAGGRIMSGFRQAGIPVIAVDIPMVGATYFGVDHYRAGHIGGVALGRWIKANWQGRLTG